MKCTPPVKPLCVTRGVAKMKKFASYEEEAAFWDMHDVTDYWDELKPVEVRFAKNLSEGITIRIESETLNQVRAYAKEQGIGPTTLMRMWVLDVSRR